MMDTLEQVYLDTKNKWVFTFTYNWLRSSLYVGSLIIIIIIIYFVIMTCVSLPFYLLTEKGLYPFVLPEIWRSKHTV